ncbi:MAG: DUF4399 domain-containing protein [Porticoccaceae bacterium]
MLKKVVACTLLAFAAQAGFAAATAAPEDARAYIISPKDGETVTSPVRVQFGLEGIGVAPAGVAWANTGHHHLLVNVDDLPGFDKPIPADAQHIHFGGGQTEAQVELEPGEHSLQLLLGDHLHIPHTPPVVSEKITIIVE